jgi:hypothetical protein
LIVSSGYFAALAAEAVVTGAAEDAADMADDAVGATTEGAADGAAGATVWLPVSCFSPLMSTLSPPLKIMNKPKPAKTTNPKKIFHIINS